MSWDVVNNACRRNRTLPARYRAVIRFSRDHQTAVMRLFIAINLEPHIRNGIFSAATPLRQICADARWVAPELMHMTVKFLGTRTSDDAKSIAALLDRIAINYREIAYDIQGAGAFPNLRRPAVVWMGVQSDPKLELINHDVESACADMGVPLDGRPFRPHITIGRIRSTKPELTRKLAVECERMSFHAESRVRSLDLMLSHHVEEKLTYTVLHSSPLGRD